MDFERFSVGFVLVWKSVFVGVGVAGWTGFFLFLFLSVGVIIGDVGE